jgi:tetratricopeptide (TPR) repeat protein
LAQKPNLALGEMRSIFIGYWNSYEHHKALIASEQIMRNPNHMAKDTRKHIDVLKFVGNLKLAAEVSYQLFKSPQHTLEDEHNAANLNFKVGSYDRAIEIRESILRNPSHVEPTDELMLALTYLKHGDPAKALALAKRYTPSTIRLIKSQNTNQVTQELFDDLLHLMTLDT